MSILYIITLVFICIVLTIVIVLIKEKFNDKTNKNIKSINPSIINKSTLWFFELLSQNGSALQLILSEGIVGNKDGFIELLGKTHYIGKQIEITKKSKRVSFAFNHYLAYQIIDETFTARDSDEIHESEKKDKSYNYQIIIKSKYLDYLNEEHGWYIDVVGPVKLYRICSRDYIVEVASFEPPILKVLN